MPLRVVAVVATRNEEACIANCLRSLISGGLRVAVIDNDSEDATREIVSGPEFASHLVTLRRLPYEGEFNLDAQIEAKQQLSAALDTDWVVHVDADEILHSYRDGERFCDFIAREEAGGHNVINFDEFVFLPIESGYVPNHDGLQPLLSYYFFEPFPRRLMRAWKKGCGLSMTSGGHKVAGDSVNVSPESGALRHYIFRSQEHAYEKYAARVFREEELRSGQHWNRVGFPVENFSFPPARSLCRLASADSRELRRDFRWPMHYWQWQKLPNVPNQVPSKEG